MPPSSTHVVVSLRNEPPEVFPFPKVVISTTVDDSCRKAKNIGRHGSILAPVGYGEQEMWGFTNYRLHDAERDTDVTEYNVTPNVLRTSSKFIENNLKCKGI